MLKSLDWEVWNIRIANAHILLSVWRTVTCADFKVRNNKCFYGPAPLIENTKKMRRWTSYEFGMYGKRRNFSWTCAVTICPKNFSKPAIWGEKMHIFAYFCCNFSCLGVCFELIIPGMAYMNTNLLYDNLIL